jgi:hypothetical protein
VDHLEDALGRFLVKAARVADTRVVHEELDAKPALPDLGVEPLGRAVLAQVGREGKRHGLASQVLREALEAVEAARDEHDMPAALAQRPGEGGADPARRAGDEGAWRFH